MASLEMLTFEKTANGKAVRDARFRNEIFTRQCAILKEKYLKAPSLLNL